MLQILKFFRVADVPAIQAGLGLLDLDLLRLNFRFSLTLGAFGFLMRFLRCGGALERGAQFHINFERDANRLQADARLVELRVYLLEAI